MESITSLVQYGGQWNQKFEYEGYAMAGILIPPDCTLENLFCLIKHEMKNTTATIEVSYQVEKSTPPMKMLTDSSVLFFLEMKKRYASKITDMPLCVTEVQDQTIEKQNSTQQNYTATIQEMEVGALILQANQSSFNEESPLEEGMSSTTNEGLNALYIPTLAEEVAEFIIEDNEKRKQEMDAIQLLITDTTLNKIEKGQLYQDKSTVKAALSYYAMMHNFQFKTKRSEPREYLVTCSDEKCKWMVRASAYRTSEFFMVRKYISEHTCSIQTVLEDNKKAKSSVVGEIIKNKYKSIKRNYTPSDIMEDMNEQFGLDLNYSKAWRSKEKALYINRGDPSDAYQNLPIYLYMLKQSNPVTITHLITDNEDRFKYLYIAFATSIKGWKYLRPIIVVDGTFLKNTHKGTLITASTLDANNKIYVLAFAIVDSENDNSWLWFFNKLKETYGEQEGMHYFLMN